MPLDRLRYIGRRASGLAHAVFDVEPAIVAREPFDFTSLRHSLSLPLFALHLAFMSFSLSAVSFIFEGFAAAGAGVAAGAVVWAVAVCRLPATSSMAARQTLVRSMGIPSRLI